MFAVTDSSGWIPAEESAFRVLRPLFPSNYCTLAEVLRTRTCEEVRHSAALYCVKRFDSPDSGCFLSPTWMGIFSFLSRLFFTNLF